MKNISNERTLYTLGLISIIALLLNIVAVFYLNTRTKSEFSTINTNLNTYVGDVDKTGRWISSIRGLMGYGGIIHNFKNYVLRGDEIYYLRAQTQINEFNALVKKFMISTNNPEEKMALKTIKATIDSYAQNLELISTPFTNNKSIGETDSMIAIDDSKATFALDKLSHIWNQKRAKSIEKIQVAIRQGEWLTWVKLISISISILAIFSIGYMLIVLKHRNFDDMEEFAAELELELEKR